MPSVQAISISRFPESGILEYSSTINKRATYNMRVLAYPIPLAQSDAPPAEFREAVSCFDGLLKDQPPILDRIEIG